MTKQLWGHWKEHEKLKIFKGISAGNAVVWHMLLNGQGYSPSPREKKIHGIPAYFFPMPVYHATDLWFLES